MAGDFLPCELQSMLLKRTKLAHFVFQTLTTNRSALATHFVASTAIQLLFYLGLTYWGGIELVGLWGWIMAAVGIMPLFMLGWSQGLLKLLPAIPRQDKSKRQALAGAGLLGAAMIPAIVFLLLALLSPLMPVAWKNAWQLLHIAPIYLYVLVFALWVVPLNLTLQQLLDAHESFVFRTVTQLHGLLYLAITALLLYPWLEAGSLALGLLTQQLVMLARSIRILHHLESIPPFRQGWWNKNAACELFQFGIRYQQASMLSALFEPVVKAAIMRTSGLSGVGLYEFASRLIQPLRSVVVQQLQILTPRIAQLSSSTAQQEYVRGQFTVHIRQTKLVFVLLCTVLPLVYGISPDSAATFVQVTLLLSIIWMANLVVVPFYYTALATGKLHRLMIVHLLQTGAAAWCWWQAGWIEQSSTPALSLVLPSIGVALGALYLGIVYWNWIPANTRAATNWLLPIGLGLLMVGLVWIDTWLIPALILLCLMCWVDVLKGMRKTAPESLANGIAHQTSTKAPIKISVVTVCLNRAHFIRETLKSVQAQSYPHVEHIVIDGGSTDGTLDILKEHQDHLAVWISEPDQNMYDALNKGYALAKGDYIHALNSDDYLASPDVYSQVVQAMETTGRKAIYHGDLVKVRDGLERRMHLFGCAYLPYLFSKHGTFISHPTVLIRKDIHEQLGGYDLAFPYSADYDYLLRATKSTDSNGLHIPIPITCFREHDTSATFSGMLTADKAPILHAQGYYLYPGWYRLFWWIVGWGYYKRINPHKQYS
jgi:hypothetical protein